MTEAIFFSKEYGGQPEFFYLEQIEEFRKKLPIEARKHLIDKNIFRLNDTVEFPGFEHLGGGIKKGVIKKLGYALGICRAYPACGIKVEGEPFGSALLHNYTIMPQSLTKI